MGAVGSNVRKWCITTIQLIGQSTVNTVNIKNGFIVARLTRNKLWTTVQIELIDFLKESYSFQELKRIDCVDCVQFLKRIWLVIKYMPWEKVEMNIISDKTYT